ncbi:MAG: haloacid dehalogenase, partial [Anaerolinea sp.]|nr:haloacid dehalogenase [Anaerolinea sp.]
MSAPSSLETALAALQVTADAIREDFSAKNAARDAALARSRELIRRCAEAIRALHRHDWADADARIALVGASADELRAIVADHADLYHSGYTQDALKEVVEAYAMAALVRGERLPTPAELRVDGATYLNGLAEAATELRRFILDLLRRDDGDTPAASAEAERLLAWMDAIYDHLVTFDFPDAITGDLRRRTDAVRAVLER